MLAAVRLYAAQRGLVFDASPWRGFWHLVDADLLRSRLLESIFYLHSQPPLFNLWLGAYAKLFGEALGFAFWLSYLGLGALLALSILDLGKSLGLPLPVRFAAAGLFCISPAALLYENFLFYSYPVLVLVTLSGCLLQRALARRGRRDFALLFAVLALIVLTRSLFHPLFLLAVGLGVMFALRERGQQPARLPFALAGLLVLSVLVKNYVLFDSFALSSWGGMSLARVALDRAPAEQRAARIAQGELSAFAVVGPFKPLERYPLAPDLLAARGVPLLDRPRKLDGAPNFHHHAFVHVSSALGRDARVLIARDPGSYLRSVHENLRQAGKSSWTYAPLRAQRAHIAGYVRAFSAAFGWFPGLGACSYGTVLALALYALVRTRTQPLARGGVLVYCALCALYVVFVGALFERSENQRFRLLVDPFLLLIAARALCDLVSWTRKVAR